MAKRITGTARGGWLGRIGCAVALSALVLSTGLLAGTGERVRVVEKGAVVRIKASETSAAMDLVKPGVMLDVVSVQGEFYRVALADRREGFISKKVVEFEAAEVPAAPVAPARAPVMQATAQPATAVAAKVAPAVAPQVQAPVNVGNGKVTVAVMPLDHHRIIRWWDWNWDIGQSMSEVLVDELVGNGHFRVLERQALDRILREQDFSISDRAEPDASKTAQIGRLAGAKYLVFGAVTEFSYKMRRFGIAEAHYKQVNADVGITLRLVDASTGAIVASATGIGTKKHRSMATSLFTDDFRGQVSMVSTQYLASDMGLATSEAARKAVDMLVQRAASAN